MNRSYQTIDKILDCLSCYCDFLTKILSIMTYNGFRYRYAADAISSEVNPWCVVYEGKSSLTIHLAECINHQNEVIEQYFSELDEVEKLILGDASGFFGSVELLNVKRWKSNNQKFFTE